ncbi:MAG: flagellar protein FlgN [Pirellulales bacterium]|nr:flagellar protein FlgN [Pirellulales bacterium]
MGSLDLELTSLLNELSGAQDELLQLLARKHRLLAAGDLAGLQAMQPQEEALAARLQACHQRRTALLAEAAAQGLPSQNLRTLSTALSSEEQRRLKPQFAQAAQRMQLLRHHSLANWVLVQRTLLHLAQLLEILATGGRQCPTYSKTEPHHPGGSLMDQAA